MAKKIINIRLEESVWQKAREDAVHSQMTLQDWITLLILRGSSERVPRTGLVPDPEVEVEVE
jgi:hypothetical protein